MSLTATDLKEIRTIIHDEVRTIVHDEISSELAPIERRLTSIESKLSNLEGKVEALENDAKTICFMLANLKKHSILVSKDFRKLTLDAKLMRINADLLTAAKQADITLPRS